MNKKYRIIDDLNLLLFSDMTSDYFIDKEKPK
jgi:hypothetical protein